MLEKQLQGIRRTFFGFLALDVLNLGFSRVMEDDLTLVWKVNANRDEKFMTEADKGLLVTQSRA